jgi:hypothetical protein
VRENYRLEIADYRLKITDCKLKIADCRLEIADCRLQIADCRLQIAALCNWVGVEVRTRINEKSLQPMGGSQAQ